MRAGKILSIVGAAILGVLSGWLLPYPWPVIAIFTSFFFCIVVGWIVGIDSGGVNRTWTFLFFPLRPFTSVRRSLWATILSSLIVFAIATCLALVWLANL